MPIYKIEINTDNFPDDEAGLQKVVADHNDTLDIPLSVEEYLTLQTDTMVKSYAKAYIASEVNVLAIQFTKADATARTAVKDLLVSFQPKFHL